MYYSGKINIRRMVTSAMVAVIFAQAVVFGIGAMDSRSALAQAGNEVVPVEEYALAFADDLGRGKPQGILRIAASEAESAKRDLENAKKYHELAETACRDGDTTDAGIGFRREANAWADRAKKLEQMADDLEEWATRRERLAAGVNDIDNPGVKEAMEIEATTARELAELAREEAMASVKRASDAHEAAAERCGRNITWRRDRHIEKDREDAARVFKAAADRALEDERVLDAAKYQDMAADEWRKIEQERDEKRNITGADEAAENGAEMRREAANNFEAAGDAEATGSQASDNARNRAVEHYESALEQFEELKNFNGGIFHPDEQEAVDRLKDKLAALSAPSTN